uniref:hypothetical protein n=1 Tax=Xanthomonas oryzae TaxID=347 RepID=UPI003DA184BE
MPTASRSTSSRDNSGGRIVASGTGASSLQADTLDNAGGIVASAGDLTVGTTLLDNTQGTLQHSGNGQLHLTAQTCSATPASCSATAH